LLDYISEITTPACEIDATIVVSLVYSLCHDAIFTTRTSWGFFHLNQNVTSACKWLNC